MALGKLSSQEVLVGVPNDTTTRKADEEDGEKPPMNNATLAYIHDNGSAAANIPARPFMVPGIQEAKPKMVEYFKDAGKSVLVREAESIDKELHKVGLTAQSAIRAKINEGPPPALADSTLAARARKGRKSKKPLVDTGQLRNSINYVIRKK